MKTLKGNISEADKVQVACLKIKSLVLMIKTIWKRKWMNWLGYTQGNARKIKNSNIFRANPNSSLGTL